MHCIKSVHIWSYSGPYFPAFGLNTERYGVSYDENTLKSLRINVFTELKKFKTSNYIVKIKIYIMFICACFCTSNH